MGTLLSTPSECWSSNAPLPTAAIGDFVVAFAIVALGGIARQKKGSTFIRLLVLINKGLVFSNAPVICVSSTANLNQKYIQQYIIKAPTLFMALLSLYYIAWLVRIHSGQKKSRLTVIIVCKCLFPCVI